MADYLSAVVDEIFSMVDGETARANRPSRNRALIDGLGRVSDAAEVAAGYQQDGPLGRDLRRIGVSWD